MNREDIRVGDRLFYSPPTFPKGIKRVGPRFTVEVEVLAVLPKRIKVTGIGMPGAMWPQPENLHPGPFSEDDDDRIELAGLRAFHREMHKHFLPKVTNHG